MVLGILAIPVFSMHLGFADAGNDAPDSTTRKAYDLMADGYGPGTNGPLEVVLEADGGTLPQDAINEVGTALAAEPGVASVGQPTTNKAADIAIFTVTPTTSPQDARTGELLAHIREDVLPQALRRYRRRGIGHRCDGTDRRRLLPAAAADAAGSSEL